jgi:hypothetical protein
MNTTKWMAVVNPNGLDFLIIAGPAASAEFACAKMSEQTNEHVRLVLGVFDTEQAAQERVDAWLHRN